MAGRSLLVLAATVTDLCQSQSYILSTHLDQSNFFSSDYWNFFTDSDPTDGFVNYVDQMTAENESYIDTNTSVIIGCDDTSVLTGDIGRDSVRLESKTVYNSGLFILHLDHMPTGCGSWPAWWTTGNASHLTEGPLKWPAQGEIDIIEQVDTATNDSATLHTARGCDFARAPQNYTGTHVYTDCNYPGDGTIGCAIKSDNDKSFGAAFNSAGGGLYAMEWTSEHIKVWMWNTGDIPADALSDDPHPSQWGIPFAQWVFGRWCPSSHIVDQMVVFDLTFCGDWDGNVFAQDCPGLAEGNCVEYVKNNPSAFTEAYWSIEFMKVFQEEVEEETETTEAAESASRDLEASSIWIAMLTALLVSS